MNAKKTSMQIIEDKYSNLIDVLQHISDCGEIATVEQQEIIVTLCDEISFYSNRVALFGN